MVKQAEAMIRAQQGERGPVWMAGEQLLEMIGQDENAAALVAQDMQHGGLSLKGLEEKIRAFAKKNGGCCTGPEAEKIIREYFGLPERQEERKPEQKPETEAKPETARMINLEDFF